MRKIALMAFFLGFAGFAVAQVSNPSIISVTTAPTGSCSAGFPNRQVISTGILLLGLAAPLMAQNAHIRWSAVASYAASEFDAATTYTALRSCNCREVDPLLRLFASNPSIFFILGAQAWTTNKATERLNETGRSRWAVVLQWSLIAAHVAAGANNLRVQQ